ncbi:MAG: ATP-dependent DNA helicase, partial [Lachnospiraceae bacterium]|nr:ATP-dependent DNA helicase [Lachnospiraceae bacterium]
AGYHAEVGLRWHYEAEEYDICLEGRADGVMEEYVPEEYRKLGEQMPLFATEYGLVDVPTPLTYIDEIKGTYQALSRIKEPYVEHLAQAKCYAYIVAMEEELSEIGVRVTYCNFEDHGLKYFHYTFKKEALEEWFEEAMQELLKWVRYHFAWKEEKVPSIQALSFPYTYREGQKELASYVYQTIYHGRKLFLEAPTGVGKTLSTVFPAVKALGQGLSEKVFYLTAKTITRTVAEETFALLRENGLAFKDIVITAKEKACFNETCDCNPGACPYATGHFDRVNGCLYAIITQEKRFSREVIEQYARAYEVCPYELSLDVSLFADGVICDYNYVFDPHVYLRRYFSGDNAGKYIFLIDESHNLLDRGREMYSATLLKDEVLEIRRLVKEQDKELAMYLGKLNKALLALKKKSDGLTLFEDVEEVYLATLDVKEQIDVYINNHNDSAVADELMDFYFRIAHFNGIYEEIDDKYVIYGHLLDNGDYLLKLFNVDPSANLQKRMEQARSSILFSATLLPIQYYKELLGGEKEDYEVYAHSVFPAENRGLFVAKDVTSKYTRRGPKEYERIAEYLHDMIGSKRGNYLAFFPSYVFMEEVFQTYVTLYHEEHVDYLLQKEDMSEEDREGFLNAFREECDCTILGFCVLGGVFSEGIDLKHDSLIGAAIVGTGLPQVGQERELLKEYFDKQGLSGFDYAYRFPGMNKVLQAAGRVIRTAEDIGIVLLLDERFLQASYKALYPREWEHMEVVDRENAAEKMAEFYR